MNHDYIMIGSNDPSQNFIIINCDVFPMNNDPFKYENILIFEYDQSNEQISKAISSAWSCNCHWCFVIAKEGIYLFHTWWKMAIFINNRTFKFVELFERALKNMRNFKVTIKEDAALKSLLYEIFSFKEEKFKY
jgi:hypothetical protein